MKYTCSSCGKTHDEWPALAFDSPAAYYGLSDDEKKEIGELTDDFCVIRHPDQTDRFIRVTLTIKVVDGCQDLDYGVWVSLSEKSFQDYSDNFKNERHEAQYFGWLNNNLPDYDSPESVPTTVFTRTGGNRPQIVPHKGCTHPLAHDYYQGITMAEAEKRINAMLGMATEGTMDD